MVLNLRRHTDDLDAGLLFDFDRPAEHRIAVTLQERRIHDRDGRTAAPIGRLERTAAQRRDADCREETRAHSVELDNLLFAVRKCHRQAGIAVAEWDEHPWNWAAPSEGDDGVRTPRSSEYSRWNNGKDLSFIPLRPERVVEVRYDHMEGTRFRHTAQFVRWREDRTPESCTFEQLDEPVSYDLADVLSAGRD